MLQQMPVASSRKFSGEIREEEELEESAESEKTAAVEATERAARIRAALGANLERSPVVIAALRRVAQGKAAREAAKDEAAVELQTKDRPKAVTEVEQGPPDALEFREGPNNGFPDDPGCPQQVGVAGVMPGQAQNLPGSCTSRPLEGPSNGPPDAPVHPHQVGVAEVVPGQAQNLPGPCTSEPRVQPPQMGLADDL